MFPIKNVKYSADRAYDLAVFSIGYEKRSSFLVRTGLTATRRVAFCFEDLRVPSFQENLSEFAAAGAEVYDVPESEYSDTLATLLVEIGPRSIAVDISSMTRSRLAATVNALNNYASDSSALEIQFFYCPAIFAEPGVEEFGVLRAAPLPGFNGSLRRASLPVGAVIGVGYEPHRALGVIEYLEPSATWVLSPLSTAEYEAAVELANEGILGLVPEDRRLSYSIADPAGIVYALDSLVFSASETRRVVLVPMGPKILALACLLVALQASPKRPAVWRVGESARRSPLLAEENGSIVGVSVGFPIQ